MSTVEDIDGRTCVKAFYWKNVSAPGVNAMELRDMKEEVHATIMSCPERDGDKFRILIDDQASVELCTLEIAIKGVESKLELAAIRGTILDASPI
jgi:hypothetical protein